MKELKLFFLMSLYLSYVSSRTLSADGDKLVGLDPKVELRIRLKQKNEANNIWAKVETMSGRAILSMQDGNNLGREEKFISETSSEHFEHQKTGDSENLTISKMNETWIENLKHFDTESLFPGDNSINDPVGFLGNHSRDINYPNSSEFSDVLVTGNLSSFVLSEFEHENISDVIVSFDNLNEEATLAEMLIESMHPLQEITPNGTFLIVEDDASLFQEVSTFGFEFLIDSETTRNSFLSELLNSHMSIADDVSEELSTLLVDWEQSTVENENFITDKGSNLLNEEALVLLSTKAEIGDLGSEKINISDFNLTGSEQNTITEKITPVCPDPGWCFFWLFAEDTCAEDHHCLGPSICCKLRCAKTCIDV